MFNRKNALKARIDMLEKEQELLRNEIRELKDYIREKEFKLKVDKYADYRDEMGRFTTKNASGVNKTVDKTTNIV